MAGPLADGVRGTAYCTRGLLSIGRSGAGDLTAWLDLDVLADPRVGAVTPAGFTESPYASGTVFSLSCAMGCAYSVDLHVATVGTMAGSIQQISGGALVLPGAFAGPLGTFVPTRADALLGYVTPSTTASARTYQAYDLFLDVTAVPEPAPLALTAMVLAGIAVFGGFVARHRGTV